MLSIEEIAVRVPATRLRVATDFERLRITPLQARVYSRLYGFGEIPVAAPGEEFALLEAAVGHLVERANLDPARLALIVHAHTGPYSGPAGISLAPRLARRFGAHIRCFGLQLHKCVSGISALPLIARLLGRESGRDRAVLLLGEVADSADLRILDTGLVGDVGCAVLLSRGGSRDRLIAQRVQIHGQYARGIYQGPAAERKAYDATFQDNLLHVVQAVLGDAGVSLRQIRYLLPHNVNVNIWLKAIERLGLDRDRVYLGNIARYGHCFGADLFINLAAIRPELRPGDYYVMATAGVGGVFGAALLQH